MNGEPAITINGQPLSEGQAMTVRVALSWFVSGLNHMRTNAQPVSLWDDNHSRAMNKAYIDRGMEALRMMTTYEEKIPSPTQPSPDSQGPEHTH